jgi:hypothetical protein
LSGYLVESFPTAKISPVMQPILPHGNVTGIQRWRKASDWVMSFWSLPKAAG